MSKALIVAVSLMVVGGGVLFWSAITYEKPITINTVVEEKEVVVDSYEHRVDALVASTTEEWEQKHRNWAEQEVTKQIVAENEERLKTLRQEELSF